MGIEFLLQLALGRVHPVEITQSIDGLWWCLPDEGVSMLGEFAEAFTESFDQGGLLELWLLPLTSYCAFDIFDADGDRPELNVAWVALHIRPALPIHRAQFGK
jgi:hypothetical protein